MEQVLEITDDRVETVEEEQLIELPVNLLDKVGGGMLGVIL